MEKYEIVYIIHPDLEGSTAKITEKVKSAVEKSGSKVLNEENWGKKKFAYEIDKNTFGIYTFLLVEMEPGKVKELERTLRLSEEIIRHMIVLAEEVEGQVAREKVMGRVKADKKEKKTSKTEKAEAPTSEGVEVPTDSVGKVKKSKKTKIETEKEEKERQKELDEKLKAIIEPDGKA